ncbi:MAG TPA: hypothetical protein VM142_01790 [Acidimicrobiales bacterium]|nr:hypothetical protein [Acidimicrobiales bacterium]
MNGNALDILQAAEVAGGPQRNDRRMWALHAGFLAEAVAPVVPAPVLAEAWRSGPRQAGLARLLAMCEVEPMSEEQARQVGVLSGKSDHDDIVDVAVVEGAVRRRDAVVTSNEDHIPPDRGRGQDPTAD